MPADASIYGQLQPIKINTPFENLSNVLQVRQQQQQIQSNQALEMERRQKLAAEQQAQDESDAYYKILSGPGTTDERIEAIRANPMTAKFYAPTLKAKQEADKSAAEAKKLIEETAKVHAEAAAAIQAHQAGKAQVVIASGNNPAVFIAQAQHEIETFPELKGEIEPAIARVQSAPPEQQRAIVAEIMDGWGHSTPASSNAMTNAAQQVAQEPGQIAQSQQQQQIAAGMQGGITAAQQATNKIAQQNAATSQGQLNVSRGNLELAKRKFEQTIGAGLDEQGRPLPPEELLRRAQADPIAKAIAEYRVPAISPRSMATPAGRALMSSVSLINPSYDATQFPARSDMRRKFTSGPQGQTLNSLNTAIEHLDQLNDAAMALQNGTFRPGNKVYNYVSEQIGRSAPTNFDGMKTIMAGELASAFKKSGATDTEIAQVKASLDRASSPAQMSDYIGKIAIPALGSKARTFEDQWKATMGDKDATFSAYTPGAKAVLDKYRSPAPTTAGPKVGDVVSVGGKRIKITAIHADGTFDGDPVR